MRKSDETCSASRRPPAPVLWARRMRSFAITVPLLLLCRGAQAAKSPARATDAGTACEDWCNAWNCASEARCAGCSRKVCPKSADASQDSASQGDGTEGEEEPPGSQQAARPDDSVQFANALEECIRTAATRAAATVPEWGKKCMPPTEKIDRQAAIVSADDALAQPTHSPRTAHAQPTHSRALGRCCEPLCFTSDSSMPRPPPICVRPSRDCHICHSSIKRFLACAIDTATRPRWCVTATQPHKSETATSALRAVVSPLRECRTFKPTRRSPLPPLSSHPTPSPPVLLCCLFGGLVHACGSGAPCTLYG